MEKPIAVLGAGAAAQTIAAHLTLKGFKINLWEHPDFLDKFKPILESRTIESIGLIEGVARLNKVTTNIKEAIENVDLINVPIPALGHDAIFDEMIPHLKDGQTVIVWSGDAGSLRLAKKLKDQAPDKKIMIAETQTMPYGTRVMAPGKVNVLVLAKTICMAALPAKDTDKVVEIAKKLYSNVVPFERKYPIYLWLSLVITRDQVRLDSGH